MAHAGTREDPHVIGADRECADCGYRAALTLDALELGYFAEAFEGFGYLGERGRELRTAAGRERVALVDAAILARANELGWTAEELFGWTNSRNGRHFADAVFGFRFGPETIARAMAELGPGGSERLGTWAGRTDLGRA